MNYLKLLQAQRSSGKTPTMERLQMSQQQQAWAADGICIKCGDRQAAAHSYICGDCQADITMDDIKKDIEVLRQKILGRPGG